MNLNDLYQKAVGEDKRKIKILNSNGDDSGHTVTLIDPFSAEGANASYMFDRTRGVLAADFEKENQELHEKCEKLGDFTEFNLKFVEYIQEVRDAFAVEVVESWDFDNPFSKEAVREAVEGFRFPTVFSFQHQIVTGYMNLVEQHAKK